MSMIHTVREAEPATIMKSRLKLVRHQVRGHRHRKEGDPEARLVAFQKQFPCSSMTARAWVILVDVDSVPTVGLEAKSRRMTVERWSRDGGEMVARWWKSGSSLDLRNANNAGQQSP